MTQVAWWAWTWVAIHFPELQCELHAPSSKLQCSSHMAAKLHIKLLANNASCQSSCQSSCKLIVTCYIRVWLCPPAASCNVSCNAFPEWQASCISSCWPLNPSCKFKATKLHIELLVELLALSEIRRKLLQLRRKLLSRLRIQLAVQLGLQCTQSGDCHLTTHGTVALTIAPLHGQHDQRRIREYQELRG